MTRNNASKKVVIDPVTRVEGHGKVTLLLDQEDKVTEARLHIVEFRGFEKFIEGRPYWEVPMIVQRLCGICPVSHHLAAGKAVDQLVGVSQLTPAAEMLRRLLHYGQVLQSHATHFFHLASPDLLFGFQSDAARRNILQVIQDKTEIARDGILLRKFGQQIIEKISGKRVHGIAAIPGGMNRPLSMGDREFLLGQCEEMVHRAQKSVLLAATLYQQNLDYHQTFAAMESKFLGLINASGALELYEGKLRVKDEHGGLLFDGLDPLAYYEFISEEVRNWSYMKFPYLTELGSESGWYRVGPLARMNLCDSISTPLAESSRKQFIKLHGGMAQPPLAFHWSRMIELLHCAEMIQILLQDQTILSTELRVEGSLCSEGVGVIEAPRGTLIHHYQINHEGLIEKANLIVSTTHNNQAMNNSVRRAAEQCVQQQKLTEGALNQIEVAIRAYDPCLSCATHAVGKMPLRVELVDYNGGLLDSQIQSAC